MGRRQLLGTCAVGAAMLAAGACGGDDEPGAVSTGTVSTAPAPIAAAKLTVGDHTNEDPPSVWAVARFSEEDGRLVLDDADADPSDGAARVVISTRTGRPLTADVPTTSSRGLRATLIPEADGKVSLRLTARRGVFETIEVLPGNTPDLVVVKAFLASRAPEAGSATQVVRQARTTSVLQVLALRPDGSGGGGTGWVWGVTGGEALLVTNFHVVSGGTSFTAALEGEPPRRARLVAAAPCDDLALLAVDAGGLAAMPLADPAALEQGQEVVALGFPGSETTVRRLVATTGTVSALDERIESPFYAYPDLVRTDAAINQGNSGGPLVTLDGAVAGVNTLGFELVADDPARGRDFRQGENYAIGAARVGDVVAGLARGESQAWPGMGLDQFSREELAVLASVPGSSAERAGVGAVDADLLAVNGLAVGGTIPGYCRAVRSTAGAGASGTPAVLTLAYRDGTTEDVPVTY